VRHSPQLGHQALLTGVHDDWPGAALAKGRYDTLGADETHEAIARHRTQA
jgi:hypothetical protein